MLKLGRRMLAGAAMVLAGACMAPGARADSPEGMKLYVFTSGTLTLAKEIIQAGGGATTVTIPVGFFVVQHPNGNVLFDTGNNDRIITEPEYWGPFIAALDPGRSPDVAIDVQLQKIGLTPDDIDYVVLGHFHVDHAGNIGKFLNSTFIYQRDEIRAGFWPAPGYATFYKSDDFSMLRNDLGKSMPNKYKAIELDGDLDLFGDGSVMIKRSVSHTPGSQLLIVRLPNTGTVVLPSDAVYLEENLNGDILPSVGSVYSPEGMLDTYAYVKYLRDAEGADIIYAHDPDVFKAHKHAPEFYD